MNRIAALPIALLLMVAPLAHAEPTVAVSERLTMPEKKWHVFIPLEIDASRGHGFEPVSLAPDVWYGMNSQLTLGLVHSQLGRTGFYGRSGDGLCLTGKKNGCDSAYNNVGFEGRYHVYEGRMTVSANAGLHIVDLDAFATALKVGAVGSMWMGSTQLVIHPNLSIGMSEREQGNREILHVPVTVMHNLSQRLQFAWQVGLGLPFKGGKDNYFIPATVALQFAPMDKLAVVGAFTFRHLIAGDDVDDGLDERSFTIGTILHL